MFKFASQGIYVCLTVVKTTKTFKEAKHFFGVDFLFLLRVL